MELYENLYNTLTHWGSFHVICSVACCLLSTTFRESEQNVTWPHAVEKVWLFWFWVQISFIVLFWLFCLPRSIGGWFRGRGKRTGLNEFPAKCPRSQGRAPRQRMAKQSMHPLASSIPTRGSHWKPRKLQVSSSFYCIMSIIACNNSLYTGLCHLPPTRTHNVCSS